MTPLAPPTEAEVKELRAWAIRNAGSAIPGRDADAVVALCDAYLAQRDLLTRAERVLFHSELQTAGQLGGTYGGDQFVPAGLRQVGKYRDELLLPILDEVRAALSAAPLAPETQNEGGK